MLYKIMQKYTKGPEILVGQCAKKSDAMMLIKAKLAEDVHFKMNAEYLLYEGSELLEKMSTADVPSQVIESSETFAGSGRQSASITPFNTAPKPAGLPPQWRANEEEDDKKK